MMISSSTDRIPQVRFVIKPVVDLRAIITLFEKTSGLSPAAEYDRSGARDINSGRALLAILGEVQDPGLSINNQVINADYNAEMLVYGFLCSCAIEDFQFLILQAHQLRYSGVINAVHNRITFVLTSTLKGWREIIPIKMRKESPIYVRMLFNSILNSLVHELGSTEAILLDKQLQLDDKESVYVS